jgi:hypothetical protein
MHIQVLIYTMQPFPCVHTTAVEQASTASWMRRSTTTTKNNQVFLLIAGFSAANAYTTAPKSNPWRWSRQPDIM